MPADPADSQRALRGRWLLAAALIGLHGLGLLVVAVITLTGSGGGDTGRVIGFAILVLVFAAAALALAAGLARHRAGARTPAIVWAIFAVLAGLSLATNGQPLLGWTVGASAAALGIAALGLPSSEPSAEP